MNLSKGYPIAVRYLSHEPKLEEWEKIHHEIVNNHYIDLCFIKFVSRYDTNKLTTFEYLMTTLYPGIYYVKTNTNTLVVKYAERLSNNQDLVMSRTYGMHEISLYEDGRVVCDLADEIYQGLVRKEEELSVGREHRQQVKRATKGLRDKLARQQEDAIQEHREKERRRLGLS